MRRLFVSSFVALLAAPLGAQAWSYPAFQPPRLESREFNFALADAGRAGTTFLVQWRELAGSRSQFTLEAGLVSPDRSGGNILVLGAAYAFEAHRASTDIPLDILLTGGAGLGLGDASTIRVPLGVSVGYRFELERDINLTPFVHPRISLDICNDCTRGTDAGVGLNFDVGANLDLTPAISLRGVGFFGGGDLFGRNGIGLSIAWRPPGLRR